MIMSDLRSRFDRKVAHADRPDLAFVRVEELLEFGPRVGERDTVRHLEGTIRVFRREISFYMASNLIKYS